MSKSKLNRLVCMVTLATACVSGFAGSVAGTGGATEVTQIANHAEMVKTSLDSAQTASYTVSQYMTQLEQYRNQLVNTVGVDPAYLNRTLGQIDSTYRQTQGYMGRLTQVRGSLTQQNTAYQQRYDAARLQNMNIKDYAALEAQRLEQGNQAAIARRERDAQIMQQVNQDIVSLQEEQSSLPSSLGMNESIQRMNTSLGRLATQNATMTTLMLDRKNMAADDADEKLRRDAAKKTIFEKQLQMQNDMRNRQTQFINGASQ